ncbi:amidohydrolase [Rhodoplanes sp. TEM]|uniref:Amidohydrolase n=1 Tax=Rhodoplanes tepidamans TaxID=200616 RepID=A0ABT5J9H2_RHOTP|nr:MULTISPECIES: amidohydrolase [Rhodoplanes]MDC7786316.1 amidohydrolase [Rhodoplanes tepidamans]MDC7984725.1 amidohydrolase [Rhodoplanes sp. TEM]MDQ0354059.1 cytosine/adenosine deaminase-related metal-dependent hydrolase [Rhodoplanes tepidamans]
MKNRLLVRDVLVLDAVSAPARRDVLVEGPRIAAVRDPSATVEPGTTTIDGRDRLLVPGLVNAHTHSPLNVLKGTGDVLSHPAFMWLNQADTAGRTADEIRLSALLGCIEHLKSGTTAVVDHFPEQGFLSGDVDAVVEAYAMSGLRALVALRVFDEPYTDIDPPGGLPASVTGNPLAPPPLADCLALIEDAIARHDGAADGRIRLCPAPSNPSRCSDALLEAVRDIGVAHDTAVHMHLLETRIQAEIAQTRYGTTMVAHLERLGLVTDRLSCAHTIWIGDDDIARMAAGGAIAVHNPESNLKLGAGIAPVARMLAAGMRVALGSDGASTNDNLDMHEVMRLAVMLQRPGEPDRRRWPTAADALTMATRSGAAVMRVPELGRIAPGAPADFVLHDLAAPFWTPLNDPLAQLVFGASGATVDTVVVDGRVLVEGGRIRAFDPEPVLREVRDLVKHLRARNVALHGLAAEIAAALP